MKTRFLSRSELKRAPCISDFVRMFELLPKRACPSQQLITQVRMSGEVEWRVVQNRPICKNKNIRQIRTSTQKYTHKSPNTNETLVFVCNLWWLVCSEDRTSTAVFCLSLLILWWCCHVLSKEGRFTLTEAGWKLLKTGNFEVMTTRSVPLTLCWPLCPSRT